MFFGIVPQILFIRMFQHPLILKVQIFKGHTQIKLHSTMRSSKSQIKRFPLEVLIKLHQLSYESEKETSGPQTTFTHTSYIPNRDM